MENVLNAIKDSVSQLSMNGEQVAALTNRYKELRGFDPATQITEAKYIAFLLPFCRTADKYSVVAIWRLNKGFFHNAAVSKLEALQNITMVI